MPQNQRQYNVTKAQVSRLQGVLAHGRKTKRKMDPSVYRAMVAGIESQMEELRSEVREYETLGKTRVLHLRSAEELPQILIKARVARGLTQKALADEIRVKPQQIQRYEATGYRAASLERILGIMKVLKLKIEAEIPLTARAPRSKTRAAS